MLMCNIITNNWVLTYHCVKTSTCIPEMFGVVAFNMTHFPVIKPVDVKLECSDDWHQLHCTSMDWLNSVTNYFSYLSTRKK